MKHHAGTLSDALGASDGNIGETLGAHAGSTCEGKNVCHVSV